MSEATPLKKKRFSTFAEIVAINDILKRVIILNNSLDRDDKRQCHYVEGYNDKRVAAEVAPDLTASHVQNIREQMYGTLVIERAGDPRLNRAEDRIARLREDVDNIMGQFGLETRKE